ncbi:ABC transporter substrate-binding protein [Alicyclobacillus curvatus]|nr:ABC transporter substrate-binding protein [Alicyclobacillus curvatus]
MFMNRKHWMTVAATVVLSSSLLAGCGGATNNTASPPANQSGNQTSGQAATDPTATITFYEAMPGALGKELQSLTDTFQSQHPTIKVQLIFNGSYTTQQQKLTAAIAARKPPTIAQVQETWETEYYNNGLLQPLGALLPQSTVNDLMPIWKDDNSYGGKLVSAPFNKSAYVLYYNTDDFAKAGITSPTTTWNQLEQDAIDLTNKAGVPGLGIQANWYTFEMLLNQAGGKVLTSDEKQAAFNDAAGQSALSFMNKLVKQDKAATVIGQNAYLSDGFNTNQYAMDLDSTAAMSFITNKNTHWKVAPLPQGTQAAVPTAGTNIVLFKSASADEQRAAVEYINFLISKENTIQWAEKTGYLPVRQSALTDPSWQQFISANPNAGVAPAEMAHAYFSPRLAALNSGMTDATTQLGNFINGNQPLSQTLKNMADAINQALAGQ